MKTKVTEVFHKGSSVVLEWVDDSDNVKRVIFPEDELIKENGEIFVENVEEGHPYGVDWESYIRTKIGPKGIADLLRKNGIWTFEDYSQNTRVVTSVFNEACSANLQSFRESVLKQGKEE